MTKLVQINLTDPGEGLTEAEVIDLRVAVGDRIEINQAFIEVETAKSAVELPSHVAGTVTRVLVSVGQEVKVGEPLIEVDTDGGAASDLEAAPASGAEAPKEQAQKEQAQKEQAQALAETETPTPEPETAEPETAEPKNLVGYGSSSAPSRRRRKRSATEAEGTDVQVPMDRVLAKPPVRKLARDLGIALADVMASGPGGTVTREDVLAAQQRAISGTADSGDYFPDESPQAPQSLGASMKSSRHQAFPGVTSDEATTRVPIRSVRKRTAEAMVSSAFTAPHVTVFNEIDMTATMELVSRLRADREWAEVHVSPLVIVAKALLVAIRRNPEVNASWDEAAQEIVYKHFVNLGIAAATPRGLIVPNIKDAHLLTLRELAEAISELARTARAGRTPLAATREGTITITNFGVFGIDSGTPILNPGESVILGMGAVKLKPWVVDGQIVPRRVAQLALSFDHRLIDGALGSELLRDVSRVLEQPEMGLVWG